MYIYYHIYIYSLELLQSTPVQSILEKLEDLGATKVSHLLDLDDEDVDSLELKKLEKKRWIKALASLKQDDEKLHESG